MKNKDFMLEVTVDPTDSLLEEGCNCPSCKQREVIWTPEGKVNIIWVGSYKNQMARIEELAPFPPALLNAGRKLKLTYIGKYA
jgi:hypothetical protein